MDIRHRPSTHQPHLLKYLDGNERDEFAEHLLKFDFEQLSDIFGKALAPQMPRTEDVRLPNPDRYIDRETLSEQEMGKLFDNGLKAVAEGKVAALVLAGGQASRLGSDRPKGAIPLGTGLGSKTDSLLFIQATQIAKIQRLVHQHCVALPSWKEGHSHIKIGQ